MSLQVSTNCAQIETNYQPLYLVVNSFTATCTAEKILLSHKQLNCTSVCRVFNTQRLHTTQSRSPCTTCERHNRDKPCQHECCSLSGDLTTNWSKSSQLSGPLPPQTSPDRIPHPSHSCPNQTTPFSWSSAYVSAVCPSGSALDGSKVTQNETGQTRSSKMKPLNKRWSD